MQDKQAFGSDPLKVRESDHYCKEYVHTLVEKWDNLIDWEARAKSEGDFFIRLLREYGCEKILDVATGTGFHSVQLMQAGFEVTSVDGSANMLAKAFENAKQHGFTLRTICTDWRCLNQDVHSKFDAIICLGNSFTHLFSEDERHKALAEFYAALRYDGILMIDHRNYDAILDHGYVPSHDYYYCGENVRVTPEHVDDSLARFRYEFLDGAVFHLNMFPLRNSYVRKLIRESGFQRVDTYADFHETYRGETPDFFIHVAKKLDHARTDSDLEIGENVIATQSYSGATGTARDYYNSSDADRFYFTVWGGEDIHVGVYLHPDEAIREASRRTVELMSVLLRRLNRHTRAIDLGAGYGGAARYLARTVGCRVACLNLSEVQNERNRRMTAEQGLSNYLEVVDGTFEEVPYENDSFDVVWSQDSFLHSGAREQVLREIKRILKPGGELIFTDPMQDDGCQPEQIKPVLERIHLDSMGSVGFYRETARRLGFEEVQFVDLSHQLPRHYARVREELKSLRSRLEDRISQDYVERMQAGLGHWVDAGRKDYLRWGIFHFRLPD